MKTLFNVLLFALQSVWVIVASMIIAVISVTSPNWTPVRYLISQNPLIGSSRKSLGNNIAYRWFNKNVWRTKALTFTPGMASTQIAQREFFTSVQSFCRSFLSTIRIGFNQQTSEMPAYSYAIGYNLRNAPNASDPPDAMSEEDAVVALGTLKRPNDLVSTAPAGKKIKWTWTNDSGQGNALATDKAMICWHNTTKATFGSELTGTVKRPAGTIEQVIPGGANEDLVYGWIFFVSADDTLVSDSLAAASFELVT
jgi:plastocyanin